MSTLFFLSHICSMNAFFPVQIICQTMCWMLGLWTSWLYTPLHSHSLFFFFFSSQTWKQITVERCNNCIPAGVYHMLFVQGGEKRNRVESWEFLHPTHLQLRRALFVHSGRSGFLSLFLLPFLSSHCWKCPSCLSSPCQHGSSPFLSWPHFPLEYVLQSSH